MKRTLSICIALCLSTLTLFAQEDSIRHRIFLIGDGGNLFEGRHPVVDWLKQHVNWDDERNTAIFLGDNIYPLGLPTEGEASFAYSKAVIDYQMSLVKGKKARAFFIMGNHDWKNGKIGGWEQSLNQTEYINGQLQKNIQAFPTSGCPGPDLIEIDTMLALTLIDSQWFLHTHEKPGPGSGCTSKTADEFSTELGEIIRSHPNQLIVVATHHPLHTFGVHGGTTYNLRHHIFPLTEAVPGLYIPLPVLGSVYPIARGLFGNIQDVNHPLYRAMANTVEEVIKTNPNAIAVSGHDHSLQLLQVDSMYQIVSGSAAEISRVSQRKNNNDLIFSKVNYGAAVIEVTKSGKVSTRFFDITSPNYNVPLFERQLFTIKKTAPPVTAAAMDTLRNLPKSATVVANSRLTGGPFSRFLVGRNYRKEWTTPVTVPVLDLASELGGLRPERRGGGKQTKSLRLQDSTGKEWNLRSIAKFPEAAIPPDLRQTFAKDVVEQGISASYPYASLSIEPLARAAGIPHLRRRLVYLPDDPRLERFRPEFKNILAVLEEREPAGVRKTDNTDEVVLKLFKDNDDHIDQQSVLKARLLDNFIMDFDRHEDQWRWAARDTGKGKLYYAIPRDHDQAFFLSQGITPRFVAKPWFVPELQGFRPKAKNINTFNRPARNFDRFFLTQMTEEDWSRQIDTFLTRMTDAVIDSALLLQPKEVRGQNGPRIAETLKKRKQYFREDMMEYYRFISRKVSITGSNQREEIRVTKNGATDLRVTINKISKDGTIGGLMYDRAFDPSVTQEVRIYALGGEDRFVVEGGDSPIKIRMIGGPGNDEFINNGTGGKLLVYDAVYEKNKLSGNEGFNNKISNDPQVNRYNRFDYKYDFINPGITGAFNVDDGFFLGVQLEVTKQGFRKDPYRMRQFIQGVRAFNTGALRFRYAGDWVKVIGNHDLLARAEIRAPVNVTNFFGLGNQTVFDKTKPGREEFYRVRYNFVDASVLLRRQLQSWMRVSYGVGFQYFDVKTKGNEGKFVSQTAINGLDSNTAFQPHIYGGAHLRLDINSRNNQVLPSRGFVLDANIRPMVGLNNVSKSLLRADVDMRLYASLFSFPRIVLATRFGWARNFGDFQFPQANYLSGINNLRGFRRDRFGGRTMMYNNTELRFKVADFSTYLFPGQIGFLVFNDVGRVWQDGETEREWHLGNGVGIWVAPIKRFVIAAHATRSKDEKFLPYVSFGFQF